MNAAGNKDIQVVRELAKRCAEVAAGEVQDQRRELWRQHNSLQPTRPLLLMRVFACSHETIDPDLRCADDFWRGYERRLRQTLFQDRLGDDCVIEPWLTVRATFKPQGESAWGPAYGRISSGQQGGAWKYDPPLKRLEDIDQVITPTHQIDEEKSASELERVREALDGIIPVHLDRAPLYSGWAGDISTHLAYLRGLDQLMWDMADNPEWLHRLLAQMRDGIIKAQQEAEDAGDWRLFNHNNQALPYACELPDPAGSDEPAPRSQLWGFFAAQEFAQVSPAMHEEFMLDYQLPIMRNFGLTAYGCCEDLTRKIDMLRRVPNLRRIAATPWADLPACAEQIGGDYVISWRPSPAETVCTGFDAERVRRLLAEGVAACKGLHLDITLKDVQTVQNDPERLRSFVRIAREVIEAAG